MAAEKVFKQMESSLKALSDEERAKLVNKTKCVFGFVISDGNKAKYTADLKNGTGSLSSGVDGADITITVSEADFLDLVLGKLTGQKAYMSGKIKVKGNIMQAMKLDGVIKELVPKSKL